MEVSSDGGTTTSVDPDRSISTLTLLENKPSPVFSRLPLVERSDIHAPTPSPTVIFPLSFFAIPQTSSDMSVPNTPCSPPGDPPTNFFFHELSPKNPTLGKNTDNKTGKGKKNFEKVEHFSPLVVSPPFSPLSKVVPVCDQSTVGPKTVVTVVTLPPVSSTLSPPSSVFDHIGPQLNGLPTPHKTLSSLDLSFGNKKIFPSRGISSLKPLPPPLLLVNLVPYGGTVNNGKKVLSPPQESVLSGPFLSPPSSPIQEKITVKIGYVCFNTNGSHDLSLLESEGRFFYVYLLSISPRPKPLTPIIFTTSWKPSPYTLFRRF